MTAVGLLSPRSIRESMDRLTPLFRASASSDKRWVTRSWRTRWAIRWLTSGVPSFMLDIFIHYTGINCQGQSGRFPPDAHKATLQQPAMHAVVAAVYDRRGRIC